MIIEKELDSVESVLSILSEQIEDKSTNRYRSSFLYRGLPNKEYKLKTSLQRNCKDKKNELEKSILRNFSKYAQIIDPRIGSSIWRQMVIGQHHGLPTRLLDWTLSPLVALHFALGESNLEKMQAEDGVIWKIDIKELIRLYPLRYQEKLNNERAWLFTVDMLEQVVADLSIYDYEMGESSMLILEPPSIDQRIISQYSMFSVVPTAIYEIEDFLDSNTNNTTKYLLRKEIKWRIRDMLDQMNMNERTIMPGLDGLCSWLQRHYYVK